MTTFWRRLTGQDGARLSLCTLRTAVIDQIARLGFGHTSAGE